MQKKGRRKGEELTQSIPGTASIGISGTGIGAANDAGLCCQGPGGAPTGMLGGLLGHIMWASSSCI